MYLRAFLSAVFASAKSSAIVGFLFGFAIAVKSLLILGDNVSAFLAPFLTALISALFGTLLAFPAIVVGTFLYCHLVKKPKTSMQNFIIAGALLSGIYGTALQYLSTFDHALYFIAAGPMAGWFMWRDIPFYYKLKKDKE